MNGSYTCIHSLSLSVWCARACIVCTCVFTYIRISAPGPRLLVSQKFRRLVPISRRGALFSSYSGVRRTDELWSTMEATSGYDLWFEVDEALRFRDWPPRPCRRALHTYTLVRERVRERERERERRAEERKKKKSGKERCVRCARISRPVNERMCVHVISRNLTNCVRHNFRSMLLFS